MTVLYKIVSTSFAPIHGGSGRWHSPKGKRPGKWMPVVKHVRVCVSGYHLVTKEAIVRWLPLADRAYLCTAEGRGERDRDGRKTAFGQARLLKIVGILDEVSMRLAAADMAERVLPIFYKVRPDDDRPAKAIQAARDYALGKIDDRARDAAGAAAWVAAYAAARAAARDAARDAARAAARAAARDAAYAAAEAAANAAGAAARAANADIILARAKKRLEEVQ